VLANQQQTRETVVLATHQQRQTITL